MKSSPTPTPHPSHSVHHHICSTVPDSLSRLTNLETLKLSGNRGLQGSLPSGLSTLTNLLVGATHQHLPGACTHANIGKARMLLRSTSGHGCGCFRTGVCMCDVKGDAHSCQWCTSKPSRRPLRSFGKAAEFTLSHAPPSPMQAQELHISNTSISGPLPASYSAQAALKVSC